MQCCGGFPQAVRDGVQDVALKVLAVASAEGLALQSFTKVGLLCHR